MEIITKKSINTLLAITLLLADFMMIAAKGMLFYTMAGPEAPRIANYYSYINPMVYFAGGMYLAPLAVILTNLAVIFLVVTLVRRNRGRTTFAMVLAAFLVTLVVVILNNFTIINLAIAILLLAASVASYWAAYNTILQLKHF